MRNLSLTLIGLLYVLMVRANADVPFSIQGIKNGDKVTVTISSSSYLETMNVTANGDYSFSAVPTGRHYVKVEASGYNVQDAKMVNVKEDGAVEPFVGVQLVVTPIEDENTWTHSWHEDGSVSGYTTTSYVNTPPVVDFLGKKIVPSDVPSQAILKENYNIVLSNDNMPWTQEFAYRLLETLKTIPNRLGEGDSTILALTNESITGDINVENIAGGRIVTISKDAFVYANPFFVTLDGVRGRFFSKRLHHALVKFVTDFGRDSYKVDLLSLIHI